MGSHATHQLVDVWPLFRGREQSAPCDDGACPTLQHTAGTCRVGLASCVYFPLTVAQEAQGGDAEQQGQRNVCVLAHLGN